MAKLLQCNLNRSGGAQDLLTQHMMEAGIGICAISEPGRIPYSIQWVDSRNGLAAVCWNTSVLGRAGRLMDRGENHVAVDFGRFRLISCYISPNARREVFLEFLDDLGEVIRTHPGSTIICGDFNSKSVLWGSPGTNTRGSLVEEWAAECDLRLVNTGRHA